MSNNGNAIVLKSVWDEQVSEIKKIFAPKLTDMEFKVFLELGKTTGANPFKKEIWAVKVSDNEPPAIFLARDFYRKRAAEMPDYEGHFTGVVCEKDDFESGVIDNNLIISRHKMNFRDRGTVKMAYCVVHRKGRRPFITTVLYDEYVKKTKDGYITKFWQKPHMMLAKVAEAACLRLAYPSEFQGTYSEDEDWNVENTESTIEGKYEVVNNAPAISKMELIKAMNDPEFQKFMDAAAKRGSKANTAELYAEYRQSKSQPAPEKTAEKQPLQISEPAQNEPAANKTETAKEPTADVANSNVDQTMSETPQPSKPRTPKPKWYKERILSEMTLPIRELFKQSGLDMKTLVAIYAICDGDQAKIIENLKERIAQAAKKNESAEANETVSFGEAAFEAAIPDETAAEKTKTKKVFTSVKDEIAPIIIPELRQKFFKLGTLPAKVIEAFNSFCCYSIEAEQQAKIIEDIDARPDYYKPAQKGAAE